jgi:hypothetical protein
MASINSALAPWSWNFLAKSGFIWKSMPRCSTICIILLVGELASRSSVISSFDSGWSAGAAATLSQPAIISRAAPITIFFPKLDFDFIAEYPSLGALPILRKHLYS